MLKILNKLNLSSSLKTEPMLDKLHESELLKVKYNDLIKYINIGENYCVFPIGDNYHLSTQDDIISLFWTLGDIKRQLSPVTKLPFLFIPLYKLKTTDGRNINSDFFDDITETPHEYKRHINIRKNLFSSFNYIDIVSHVNRNEKNVKLYNLGSTLFNPRCFLVKEPNSKNIVMCI
ncbi:hypothetical protein CDIK_2965 [Cucumispora dikerogammari]|nr:hypothetical protein CDIK_2965 [Cucumispora dikerogammari]